VCEQAHLFNGRLNQRRPRRGHGHDQVNGPLRADAVALEPRNGDGRAGDLAGERGLQIVARGRHEDRDGGRGGLAQDALAGVWAVHGDFQERPVVGVGGSTDKV